MQAVSRDMKPHNNVSVARRRITVALRLIVPAKDTPPTAEQGTMLRKFAEAARRRITVALRLIVPAKDTPPTAEQGTMLRKHAEAVLHRITVAV